MQDPTVLIILMVVCFIGLFIVLSLFVIIPILGTFGGIGYLWNRQAKQAKALESAAKNWPMTKGTIIKSRVQVSPGEYTTVNPHIEYRYQVGAVEYTSMQVRPGDKLINKYSSTECYDLVEQYPVGAEVDVYYNPKDPSEAVLEN